METKFTPAPWAAVVRNKPSEAVVVHIPNGGFDISNIPDSAANAHLISKAPDMYHKLKQAQQALRKFGVYTMADEIEQLLAEARGEEN